MKRREKSLVYRYTCNSKRLNKKNLMEEGRIASERECKLMSSVIYEIGLELQKHRTPKLEDTPSRNQPKSLLNQKRREVEKLEK